MSSPNIGKKKNKQRDCSHYWCATLRPAAGLREEGVNSPAELPPGLLFNMRRHTPPQTQNDPELPTVTRRQSQQKEEEVAAAAAFIKNPLMGS